MSITYADFDKPPLPAVTMIFAAVDGGKALVRKKPEVARIVHNALGRIIQLLLMPERDGHQDGYLCRQQEGVLKYMLAFREPARAVEWALLLQVIPDAGLAASDCGCLFCAAARRHQLVLYSGFGGQLMCEPSFRWRLSHHCQTQPKQVLAYSCHVTADTLRAELCTCNLASVVQVRLSQQTSEFSQH